MYTPEERRHRKLESNRRGRRRQHGEDVPIVAPGRKKPKPHCPECGAEIDAAKDCDCPPEQHTKGA